MTMKIVSDGMGCWGLERLPDGQEDSRTLREVLDAIAAQPWKGMLR